MRRVMTPSRLWWCLTALFLALWLLCSLGMHSTTAHDGERQKHTTTAHDGERQKHTTIEIDHVSKLPATAQMSTTRDQEREAQDSVSFRVAWNAKPSKPAEHDSDIPRIIWQTFSTSKFLKTAHYIDDMRKQNPSFEFVLVNDSVMVDYMKSYTAIPTLAEAFFAINPQIMAARADLWRYAVLYDVGGGYIDIDSSCTNIDGIIKFDDEAVISWAGAWHRDTWAGWWAQHGYTPEIDQWCLFFKPKHPLMKKVIDLATHKVLSPLSLGRKVRNMHEHVLRMTGPKLFMEAMDLYDKGEHGVNRIMKNGEYGGQVRILTEDFDKACNWKVLGWKDKTLDKFASNNGAIHYSDAGDRIFAKKVWPKQ